MAKLAENLLESYYSPVGTNDIVVSVFFYLTNDGYSVTVRVNRKMPRLVKMIEDIGLYYSKRDDDMRKIRLITKTFKSFADALLFYKGRKRLLGRRSKKFILETNRYFLCGCCGRVCEQNRDAEYVCPKCGNLGSDFGKILVDKIDLCPIAC